ncbi:MAG: GntR family transcriptional regulator [Verrucomicrobiaceae bacterium]|nr:GntR family transcriptional regulator [Verrucomicrobiaceae bacterium]
MSRGSSPAQSLTQETYQRLREALLACRLPPGERISISYICSRWGVSPGAVREALSRLTSEGLVIAEPQRGFRAAPISAEDLRNLTMARSEIEVLCLKSALKAGDISWEGRLLAAYHKVSRLPPRSAENPKLLSEAYADAHREYHDAVVSGCDNPVLLKIREQLYAQSERYQRLSMQLVQYDRDLNDEHRALVEAAIARDETRAVALLRTHVEEILEMLVGSLERYNELQLTKAGAQTAAPEMFELDAL